MQSMDPSIYRLRQRDILTFCVLALLCLGMIMVQSAAMNVTGQARLAVEPAGDEAVRVLLRRDRRRSSSSVIATTRWLGRRTTCGSVTHPIVWLLAGDVLLNVLVLVPHVGITKNGARRWLPLGFTQLAAVGAGEVGGRALPRVVADARPVTTSRSSSRGFVPTLDPDRRDLPADRHPGLRHGRADRDLRADDAAGRPGEVVAPGDRHPAGARRRASGSSCTRNIAGSA